MTTRNSQQTTGNLTWLFLAGAAISLYFYGLDIPLLGPDEPRYSQVAAEMFESGDWVTPTLDSFNWFEKPVLLYWLQIIFYGLFGVTEFAARFGSALFGLGTVFSLFLLGKFHNGGMCEKNKGDRTSDVESETDFSWRTQKNDFASWLFIISATSIGLLAFSRGASFDIILTFPITASLIGFFIFDSTQRLAAAGEKSGPRAEQVSPAARHLSLLAFYFFIGLALLAKGLIGIVFPFAIVGFYYLLSFRRPGRAFIFSLFWGTAFSLLIASSWYLPMYLTHGWEFIDEFFLQHHFQRYTSNKYMHPQPFWFFWSVLPLMTIPWLPFFLAAVWNLFKSQGRGKSASQRYGLSFSPLQAFALSWLLVPLVFFSFSGSKLPGYILPALPAALILTAEFVTRFAEKSKNREKALKLLAGAMLVVIFLILQFFVDAYVRRDTVKYLIAAADAEGYAEAKILTLHTISHNAEFYGAGRLTRRPDGKQRYFHGPAEVLEYISLNKAKPVLVLVPLEYLTELLETNSMAAEVLGENGELAIVAVSLK